MPLFAVKLKALKYVNTIWEISSLNMPLVFYKMLSFTDPRHESIYRGIRNTAALILNL
jgi:hypothetical protein